jgi:hypothetical protein
MCESDNKATIGQSGLVRTKHQMKRGNQVLSCMKSKVIDKRKKAVIIVIFIIVFANRCVKKRSPSHVSPDVLFSDYITLKAVPKGKHAANHDLKTTAPNILHESHQEIDN